MLDEKAAVIRISVRLVEYETLLAHDTHEHMLRRESAHGRQPSFTDIVSPWLPFSAYRIFNAFHSPRRMKARVSAATRTAEVPESPRDRTDVAAVTFARVLDNVMSIFSYVGRRLRSPLLQLLAHVDHSSDHNSSSGFGLNVARAFAD